MKSNEFLSSLGDIESNFIKEAAAVEQASSRRHGRIIAAAAAALALLAAGAVNGGARDVLGKAVKICTECIGLG